MSVAWREAIWQQFGGALDTLGRALEACPDSLWADERHATPFWYSAHHTLFFADLYLHEREEGWRPPEPFGMEELDPAGVRPPRVHTRAELRSYLAFCRDKARRRILGMDDAEALGPCGFADREPMSCLELILMTLRHVQHHAAQLNRMLREETGSAPRWVFRADDVIRARRESP